MLEMVVKITSIKQMERFSCTTSSKHRGRKEERGERDGVWTQHSDQPERVCVKMCVQRVTI